MSDITDELIADAGERMAKSVDSTRDEFGSVRTGRASPALLDRDRRRLLRRADAAASSWPRINAPEARLLTVQPYDQRLDQERSRRRSWSPTSA